MDRRRFLRTAGAGAALAAAGCLERIGFEEQSAWRDQPLVDDRPDAVYVPASVESMGTYGTATAGEYAVSLSYTFPHRFWTVTGEETTRVVVGADDSLHLMVTPWDPETGTVLPVDASLELRRDGDRVTELSPWPMLSQRMGFHYGDNVELPGEGEYTASVRVGPVPARLTGAFDGRFETARTVDLDFEFDRSAVHDLDLRTIEADRRGSRGAVPLMSHGMESEGEGSQGMDHDGEGSHGTGHEGDGSQGHDADGDHPPTSDGRPVEELPGRRFGPERSGDAKFHLVVTEVDRLRGDATSYLAVLPRTPHNDVPLPFTSISAAIRRDGTVVREESLRETLDGELGHHYGLPVDDLSADDRVEITVDSPPQVSRHDGYETALFEFDPLEFAL